MKKQTWFGLIAIFTVLFVGFTSCSSDDGDAGGSNNNLSGYWLCTSVCEKDISDAIDGGWLSSEGTGCGSKAYYFVNGNTVHVLDAWGYITKKSNTFYQVTVRNKTVYFRPEVSTTYTYALVDNKVYITNGDILTLSNNKLYLDGESWYYNYFSKVK